MKKILLLVLVLLLSVSFIGCVVKKDAVQPIKEEQQKAEPQQVSKSDEEAVTSLVKGFGSKLQTVSLQAPKDILEKSMQESYGKYVSQTLLSNWISNPLNAPGRLTSSPWPDSIDILSAEKLAEDEYEVKGEIIEKTSVDKDNAGIAAKRPITLKVKKTDSTWLIADVALGTYNGEDSIIYKNSQYGFDFSLPKSWKDYSIVTDKWEGVAPDSTKGEKVTESGPLISIRHPEWTAEKPRQDIPIMVFTIDQWNMLKQDKFHIGAAPIGPKELGRSSQYVFALPARYNFAFQTGYEEVEDILDSNPLHTN